MTNVQLYIAVGLPVLAVITSLIISLVQISGIREDIRELRSNEARLLERIDRLAERLAEKLDVLTGKVIHIDNRVP